jgi:hypothetical protein
MNMNMTNKIKTNKNQPTTARHLEAFFHENELFDERHVVGLGFTQN